MNSNQRQDTMANLANLPSALQAMRQAVDEFLGTARAVPAERWSEPRAPGKWSPGQVTEHVAVAFEANGSLFRGPAPGGPPRLLRPLIRHIGLAWVLRRGEFPRRSRAPRVMQPGPAPAAPPVLLARLRAAADAFEAGAAAHPGARLEHPYFGLVPLTDFVRLQEIHTRHHRAQLAATG